MGREVKRVPLNFDAPLGEVWIGYLADRTDPPLGEGWQVWSTYYDGPLSPVFPDAEALARWLTTEDAVGGLQTQPMTIEQARRFIQVGSAPTAVFTPIETLDGSIEVGKDAIEGWA